MKLNLNGYDISVGVSGSLKVAKNNVTVYINSDETSITVTVRDKSPQQNILATNTVLFVDSFPPMPEKEVIQ